MKRQIESAPPPSTAGEPFMQALRIDHARLSRVLREIDARQAMLQEAPESARPVLAEAMRYLLHYQHAFHHPREDRLFERISARAPQFGREMRALIREHRGGQRQAEKLAADLADATAAALRGRDGARLARRLTAYVAHTRNHMRSEETVFYGRSERVLEDADWNALLAEATPDDPMGDRALLAKQYPHLAAQLFQPVSDVRGRGDAPPTGGGAPDRARAAIRDGVEQLAELYGELIHDAFAVVRSNLANVQSVRTPWGLVRATGPIGARSCGFVVRCLAEPPRLAVATVARFLAAWRPAGTRPGASRNPA